LRFTVLDLLPDRARTVPAICGACEATLRTGRCGSSDAWVVNVQAEAGAVAPVDRSSYEMPDDHRGVSETRARVLGTSRPVIEAAPQLHYRR
jgi:hypothetical protein